VEVRAGDAAFHRLVRLELSPSTGAIFPALRPEVRPLAVYGARPNHRLGSPETRRGHPSPPIVRCVATEARRAARRDERIAGRGEGRFPLFEAPTCSPIARRELCPGCAPRPAAAASIGVVIRRALLDQLDPLGAGSPSSACAPPSAMRPFERSAQIRNRRPRAATGAPPARGRAAHLAIRVKPTYEPNPVCQSAENCAPLTGF
jgi:hypothetical protein